MTPPRVNWEAAWAYYAALPPERRQFSAVAARFGVSDTAVRKQAIARGWLERIREVDTRTRGKVENVIVRDRAREITKTLEIIALAESELLGRPRAGGAEVRLADLPALVRLRELLLGEATERVQVGEVKIIVHAAFAVGPRFIEPARRQDYLDALRAAVGGIVSVDGTAGELEAGADGQ